ncbi:MAG: ketol-acid reductoisomerase [Candidatus Krumholzibacteriia bacterium]|jgi:ketol-acid reductoisomerase
MFEQYPPQPGTEIRSDQVSMEPLAGQTIAIIGYGTMGRAQALNLQRSGCQVVVGSRADSKTAELARSEKQTVLGLADAVSKADVVMLMLPDEAMAEVYQEHVAPNLKAGAALGFAHGFAIAFDQIKPPHGSRCFLVAPKSQGDMLLKAHAAGGVVPGLIAVTDDAPDETWDLAAAYALAVGCVSGGAFVTTFRNECISDQFGEQVVLCGGVVDLVKAAFDIMVKAGYGEENAYFECVHELKLITDLLHQHGVDGMRSRISGTAAYGGLTRGPEVVDESVRDRMRKVLQDIESGAFAREFLSEHQKTKKLAEQEAAGSLAQVGRKMLPRLHPENE